VTTDPRARPDGAPPPAAPAWENGESDGLLERAYRASRTFFFTGLLVVIPPTISLFILFKVWEWLDDSVVGLLPPSAASSMWARLLASLVGILMPVVCVMLAGAAAHTYIGARIQSFYEKLIVRVPILGRVFTWIRQLSRMVFTEKREVFTRVALVEYPRKGLWTLAFLSSPASDEIKRKSASDLVSIFVPTTPNPTSGFLLMIPAGDVILLDLGPEEALKIILSGGIISPEASAIRSPEAPASDGGVPAAIDPASGWEPASGAPASGAPSAPSSPAAPAGSSVAAGAGR
jgi:uncharacterized membrane protein